MKCFISKIIIDSREETGRKLPGFVSKHLEKCRDCRAYRNLGKQLSSVDPYSTISDLSMADLNRKIVSELHSNNTKGKDRFRRRIFSPVPVAAALFFIILSLGIFLFQNLDEPSKTFDSNLMAGFETPKNIKGLNDLFTKVESPIVKEAEELRRSLNSAGKYLRSVMDFGLPGIPD